MPARQPKRKRRSAPPPPPPAAPGRWLIALIVACGLLVLLNNTGALPDNIRERLVIGPRGIVRDRAVESRGGADASAPVAAPRRPPVPAVRPPAEPEPHSTSSRPAPVEPPSAPAPKPEPEPPLAEPNPQQRPAPNRTGALTPDERRERLADLTFPTGFTTEWSGGPAVLRVAANELNAGASSSGRVALTFDGNFDDSQVGALLAALSAAGVKSTFFLTGKFARDHPDAVRRIAAADHEIANHSNTHPRLTELSDEEVLAQAEVAEKALLSLARDAYRPYLRPPFGDRDLRVLRLLVRNGFVPVYWTVDTLDWKPGATAESVYQRIRDGVNTAGAIVLCHAGAPASIAALPRVVDLLRARGWEPDTLSAVFSRGG